MIIKEGTEVGVPTLVDAINTTYKELEERTKDVGEIGPLIAQHKALVERLDTMARRPQSKGAERLKSLNKGHVAKLGFELFHKAKSGMRFDGTRQLQTFDIAKDLDEEDPLGAFQDACDKLYVFCAWKGLLESDGTLLYSKAKQAEYFNEFAQAREHFRGIAKESFDTLDAGAGLEWVPTEASTRLFEYYRLEPGVKNLFEEIAMPRGKMDFPAWLAGLTMYRVAQRTDDPYTVNSTARVPDMLGSTNFTGKISFDAEKFGGIVFTSKELEEDAVVAVVEKLQVACVRAAVEATDDCIINGSAANNLDADVIALGATDRRTAWGGLREYALGASGVKVDAGGVAINSDALWNSKVRAVKGQMGKFGSRPSRIARIASPIGENQIGAIPKFANAYAFAGLSTSGGAAALENGFKPDGVEVVVSEFMRDDLSANGKNAAPGDALTGIITVFRDGFALGTVRQIRLEVARERWFEYDVDAVKVTMRKDFQSVLTGKIAGITYNMSTAE